MAVANETRVDTTFIGLLLVGLALLLLGVFEFQSGGLFGDDYKNSPLDYHVFALVMGVVGIILIILTIFAYRTGNKISAGVFAFVGLFLIVYDMDLDYDWHMGALPHGSSWFLYVALAIIILIVAIYVLVEKAPKFLALLLLLLAFASFFFALASFYGPCGPGSNIDICKAMGIVTGIFGILGFIVATYLGLAYSNPKKIPLI